MSSHSVPSSSKCAKQDLNSHVTYNTALFEHPFFPQFDLSRFFVYSHVTILYQRSLNPSQSHCCVRHWKQSCSCFWRSSLRSSCRRRVSRCHLHRSPTIELRMQHLRQSAASFRLLVRCIPSMFYRCAVEPVNTTKPTWEMSSQSCVVGFRQIIIQWRSGWRMRTYNMWLRIQKTLHILSEQNFWT